MPEERPAQWWKWTQGGSCPGSSTQIPHPPLTFSSLELWVVLPLAKVAQLDFLGWGPPDYPELGGKKALCEGCCHGDSRLAWKQSVMEQSARGT